MTEGAVRTGAITTTGALITSLLLGILSYTSCIIALKIHINQFFPRLKQRKILYAQQSRKYCMRSRVENTVCAACESILRREK